MDRASRRPRSFFCLSALVLGAAHRDRDQRNTRLTQFATIKCTTPLEHLVRVHTMGLRHLGYTGARLQRQLHNLELLRNRPETANTTTRTQPYCVRHEPIFGSPLPLSLQGTRRTLTILRYRLAVLEAALRRVNELRREAAQANLLLRNWVTDQIIQDVPGNIEACEFDCRKSQCTLGKWETCDRRLHKL